MSKLPKPQRLKALATYRVLASRARAVLGTAKLSSKAINAIAKTAAMSAVGSAGALSASVRASLLVTGAETGKFFTLINVDDTLTASEIRAFNMSKLLANEVQAVDRALAQVRKVFSDAAAASDASLVQLGKGAADSVGTSEEVTRAAGKALEDSLSAVDAPAKGFSTGRADAFTAHDDALVTAGKVFVDATSAAEAFSRAVAFVRYFNDVADATDAINAAILTDDGQIALIGKAVFDSVATGTTIDFDVARVQTDEAATIDKTLFELEKVLASAALVDDIALLGTGKSALDYATTTDNAVLGSFRVSQDSATATDVRASHLAKVFSDTVTTADSTSLFMEAYYETGVATSEDVEVVRIAAGGVPPQLDEQTVADLAALGVSKNFSEVVEVTDDLYGVANIDDDQVNFVGKNVSEILASSELRTVSLQRTLAESASANSTGLLAMTDYCDSAYFSQAYVGTERIFS